VNPIWVDNRNEILRTDWVCGDCRKGNHGVGRGDGGRGLPSSLSGFPNWQSWLGERVGTGGDLGQGQMNSTRSGWDHKSQQGSEAQSDESSWDDSGGRRTHSARRHTTQTPPGPGLRSHQSALPAAWVQWGNRERWQYRGKFGSWGQGRGHSLGWGLICNGEDSGSMDSLPPASPLSASSSREAPDWLYASHTRTHSHWASLPSEIVSKVPTPRDDQFQKTHPLNTKFNTKINCKKRKENYYEIRNSNWGET